MAISIHPTAIVDKEAQLADGVKVGPFCIIGPKVSLGKNVELVSHVTLYGDLNIGADCILYSHVSMGHPPQDFKHKGGPVGIVIGERNVFREYVTVHPGTDCGHRNTIIGNDGFFMVGCHIAHECRIGDHAIIANYVQLAGAVTIGNYCNLGGLAAIHQFTRIGNYAFIAGMATVIYDVIPYGYVKQNPAHLAGLNIVGLKRRGFDKKTVRDLRAAYRLLFAAEGTFVERQEDTARLYKGSPEVMEIVDFIKAQDKRPIALPSSGGTAP